MRELGNGWEKVGRRLVEGYESGSKGLYSNGD